MTIRSDAMKRRKEFVDGLNVMDDEFFQKIMEDTGTAEEILQILMNDKQLRLIRSETQKFLRNCGSRSVILDALCIDANDRYFNVEMQKSDDDDHQRRVRYNGSNFDTVITEKGVDFKELPEVHAVYLTKFDIFGRGFTAYHINRVVEETGEIVDNGFHELYVNTRVNDGSIRAELMQYIKNTRGRHPNFPKLSRRVRYFKEEQEGINMMSETVARYVKQEAKILAEELAEELAEKKAEELAEKKAEELAEKKAEELAEKKAEELAEKKAQELAANLIRNGVPLDKLIGGIPDFSKENLEEIYRRVIDSK